MPTFDWLSIYPYLVAAGNLLGFWVKSRPNTGWLHNVLIPKWTFSLGFAAALLVGIQKFGEAAGIGGAALDANSVHLAGWSLHSLWSLVKVVVDALMAGGATLLGSRGTYELGLRHAFPVVTPKGKR